jgi:hypothetical protein
VTPETQDRLWAVGDVALWLLKWSVKIAGLLVLGAILLFVLRWAYTEYWISQHCTTVLGTRVCQ